MPKIVKYLFIYLALLLYFLCKIYLSPFNGKDYVVFLNAGNGDAILIASNNEYLLLDGGDSSNSLNNLYKYTNLKFPSHFAISHFHIDHLAGIIYMISNIFTYYDIYTYTGFIDSGEDKKNLNVVLHQKFIGIVKNDLLKMGKLNIQVISPAENCNFSSDPNICSLVLVVSKGDQKILLTGDSTKESQEDYLHQVGENIVLIKVPHQGSDNALNKNLINKINPKIAIFSVGENNYGHPKKSVIDFYKSVGSTTYRTDLDGDIVFFFK